jgi:hypothetical protein
VIAAKVGQKILTWLAGPWAARIQIGTSALIVLVGLALSMKAWGCWAHSEAADHWLRPESAPKKRKLFLPLSLAWYIALSAFRSRLSASVPWCG